jgi:hypothetical protein
MNFKLPERIPIQVKCDLHAHEKAFWLVVDHPYATITKADGTFEIPLIPYGEYSFVLWHEESGYLDRFKTKIRSPVVERPAIQMNAKMLEQ